MISYKQFIAEKWSRGMLLPYNDDTPILRDKMVTDTTEIGGKKVGVHFTKSYLRDKHVKVDFTVDHSFKDQDSNNLSPTDKINVLHHVHKVISDYIKKKKPKSISMSSNSYPKKQLYKAYAASLAKKHNGEVDRTADDIKVNFGQNK